MDTTEKAIFVNMLVNTTEGYTLVMRAEQAVALAEFQRGFESVIEWWLPHDRNRTKAYKAGRKIARAAQNGMPLPDIY